MFSPRRTAQLGLVSAVAMLALNIAILVHGSATAELKAPPAPQASANVMPVNEGPLVLGGASGASLNH